MTRGSSRPRGGAARSGEGADLDDEGADLAALDRDGPGEIYRPPRGRRYEVGHGVEIRPQMVRGWAVGETRLINGIPVRRVASLPVDDRAGVAWLV